MLVLSRKKGQKIVVGGSVYVTVVEISDNRVKLTFDAPHEVPIHREEVYRRIQKEKELEEGQAHGQSPFFSECA